MSTIKNAVRAVVGWVKAHPQTVKRDLTVIGAALAAQPAVHALLAGDHVASAAVIAAVIGAAKVAARKLLTGD